MHATKNEYLDTMGLHSMSTMRYATILIFRRVPNGMSIDHLKSLCSEMKKLRMTPSYQLRGHRYVFNWPDIIERDKFFNSLHAALTLTTIGSLREAAYVLAIVGITQM